MATGSRTKNRAVRAEKARATRRRIIAVAAELFTRDGYLQTTMADIARQAEVAVQTLYLSFGSKVAVLDAALDVAIAGDDQPLPVLERPWFAQLRAEPDPVAALDILADNTTEIIARVYPLYAAMSNASADPELAEVRDRNKRQRFASHLPVMQELAGRAGFNPRLPVERATEIFYTLMSEETYGLLIAEHGWSVPDWSGWARGHIRAELFPDTL
jgi:AcrR family transcriptional regulator